VGRQLFGLAGGRRGGRLDLGFVGTRALLWTGAATARRVKLDPAVPLSFADGFPLLLIGQASLDDCRRKSAVRWRWSVSGPTWW
jgi:uncharacterized protein YcbX